MVLLLGKTGASVGCLCHFFAQRVCVRNFVAILLNLNTYWQVDQWLFSSVGKSPRTKGALEHCMPFSSVFWTRFHFQMANKPIAASRRLPCIFWRWKAETFCFLWIGYYATEQLGVRGLGVKASSVSVSMCALYTCVCPYASVSYECFLQVHARKRVWSAWMCHYVQHHS